MNNQSEVKKIRILQCIRQGQVGGGESHVIDLSRSLNRNEFEPIVLSFTDGPMITTLKSYGIKAYVIPTESGFDFKVWKQVVELIKNEKIDIVHAHGTRANSNTFWAAKQTGRPFVYTVHGWSFHQDQSPIVRKIREAIEKLLTNESDVTISVSFSNQRDGIERFNMPRSKVIYYGVDLERFDIKKKFKNVQSEWNIPEGKMVVGFLVRMTIQKDPHTMLKAIQKVLSKTKDIYFVLIGDGDLKESSLALADKLNIKSNIIFEDFRMDVPDILNSIDVYCLPSLWEGMPIGLIEAMSMKKAVIASPVDGTKEAIVNEVTGMLVPVKKPDLLAEAILKLHNEPELREKIADNAYRFALRKFDMNRMANEVESIYKRILIKRKINPFIKLKNRIKKLIPFFIGKKLRGIWQKLLRILYIGRKYYCPYCKKRFRAFLSTGIDIPIYSELEVIGAGKRKNCTCPRCYSTDRDRLLFYYLDKYKLADNSSLLHIMPEPPVKSLLKTLSGINYQTGRNFKDKYFFDKDYFQLDVTNLYYDSNTFDVVMANHVLQNINDDNKALNEIYRVLKPGGKAILQVPISYKIDKSIEDEYLVLPKVRAKYFFNYEKVRLYGTDFFEKLKKTGFDVEMIDPNEEGWGKIIQESSLNPDEKLIVAVKN